MTLLSDCHPAGCQGCNPKMHVLIDHALAECWRVCCNRMGWRIFLKDGMPVMQTRPPEMPPCLRTMPGVIESHHV